MGYPEDMFRVDFDMVLISVWLPVSQKLDVSIWDTDSPCPGGRTPTERVTRVHSTLAITDPLYPILAIQYARGGGRFPPPNFLWLHRIHTKYRTGQKYSSVQGL